MHSLKTFTAQECNRILARTGVFWQDESYDHWVRDDDELLRIIDYIDRNPVKAKLACSPLEFRFSSAHDRENLRIPPGEPLFRGVGFQPA